MTCPFCKSAPLQFIKFDASYGYSRLDVGCLKCNIKLEFTAKQESQGLGKPKKTIWILTSVGKLGSYERDEIITPQAKEK